MLLLRVLVQDRWKEASCVVARAIRVPEQNARVLAQQCEQLAHARLRAASHVPRAAHKEDLPYVISGPRLKYTPVQS